MTMREDEFPKEWVKLAEVDFSEDSYDVDQAAIYQSGEKIILATASGCSCWDGDWETEEYASLDELETSLMKTRDANYNPSPKAVAEMMTEARGKTS